MGPKQVDTMLRCEMEAPCGSVLLALGHLQLSRAELVNQSERVAPELNRIELENKQAVILAGLAPIAHQSGRLLKN